MSLPTTGTSDVDVFSDEPEPLTFEECMTCAMASLDDSLDRAHGADEARRVVAEAQAWGLLAIARALDRVAAAMEGPARDAE